MTFNENANVGGNTARRRGGGIALAGGGITGIGALAVLLLGLFTGGDFSSLLGPLAGGGGGGQESEVANCETGADANRSDACRLAAASLNLDQYWAKNLEGYRQPQLIIVDQSTSTACGTASNATGPFYCPPEETVYVDPTFFAILREQFDATAGPLAQLYVLAHEYGHHVQNIGGIMEAYPDNGTGPDSNGVRTELQADCLAGAWVPMRGSRSTRTACRSCSRRPRRRSAMRWMPRPASATTTSSASPAHPSTRAFTHGSSEQRQRWFQVGYQGGYQACDTFGVPGDEL